MRVRENQMCFDTELVENDKRPYWILGGVMILKDILHVPPETFQFINAFVNPSYLTEDDGFRLNPPMVFPSLTHLL